MLGVEPPTYIYYNSDHEQYVITVIIRNGKNSLFFFRKSRLFLVSFRLNLVCFLVAFSLNKSPLSLLFGHTVIYFFKYEGHFL